MNDERQIRQYLGAIYRMDQTGELAARTCLEQEAMRLVDTFWLAIAQVAEALWAQPYTPVVEAWHTDSEYEKTLGGSAIVEILSQHNISAVIDDSTSEDGPEKLAD